MPNETAGRGKVIAGGILLGLAIAVTLAAFVYFWVGYAQSPQAMSFIFIFLVIAWLIVVVPLWFIGVPLIALGRQEQRGPVAGRIAAWVVALGGLPLIGSLMTLAMDVGGLVASAFIVSIPVGLIVSLIGAGWLIWGKPAVTA